MRWVVATARETSAGRGLASARAALVVLATLLATQAQAQSAFGSAQRAPNDAEASAQAATDLFSRAETELERAMAERSVTLLRAAQRRHREAAAALADTLRDYGQYDTQFELRLMYANALSTAGQGDVAARAYAIVRDDAPQPARRRVAARRVVESWQRWIEERRREGVLQPRVDPPDPVGEPRQVPRLEMPEPIASLLDAWLRVPPGDPSDAAGAAEHLQAQYEAAVLRYRYGHWDEARPALERIFRGTCETAMVGRLAYQTLYAMAIQQQDSDQFEVLAREFITRACTFGEPPSPYAEMPLHCFDRPDFARLRQRTRAAEALPDWEQQAAASLALADEWLGFEPACDDAAARAQVRLMAAGLVARGGQALAAANLFEEAQHLANAAEALEEPRRGDVSALRSIEAEAVYRRFAALATVHDYPAAERAARELIDDPRFAAGRDEGGQEWRLDLLGHTAWLHYVMGRYREADALRERLERDLEARARRRARETSGEHPAPYLAHAAANDRSVLRQVTLFGAQLAEAQGQTSRALAYHQRFVTEFADDHDAMMLVRARWAMFELSDRARARPTRAALNALLREVIVEVDRSAAHSHAGLVDFAARAHMWLVDGHVEQLQAYVRAHPRMTEATLARSLALADAATAAYAEALDVHPSRWGAVGISRSADAYAAVLRALDDTIRQREPQEWQRAARSSLRCHVIVLDGLALGHGQQYAEGWSQLETSTTRLALADHSEVTRCGANPPHATRVFPARPLDPRIVAPLGMTVAPPAGLSTPDLVAPSDH